MKLKNNKFIVRYECPRFLTISWPRAQSPTRHINIFPNNENTRIDIACPIRKYTRSAKKAITTRTPPPGFIPDKKFELILP